jgi:uncharacterized protein YutE (UPF0331/DUF86 family)
LGSRDGLGHSESVFDRALSGAGPLFREQAEKLRCTVGFRNIAVHDYQPLNLDIVREIIRSPLDDLRGFGEWAVGRAG